MSDQVLYFSAVWCAPCKVASSNVKRLKEKYPDIEFHKLDVDDDVKPAQLYQVRSVPTLVHLVDGKEVARVVGVRTVEDFAKELSL